MSVLQLLRLSSMPILQLLVCVPVLWLLVGVPVLWLSDDVPVLRLLVGASFALRVLLRPSFVAIWLGR